MDGFCDQRFEYALFRGAPVGIAYVGLDGKWLEVNHQLVSMLGYSQSELLGMTFRSVTHPQDLDGDNEEVNRMLGTPDPEGYNMVKRYITKQGSSVWLALHVKPIIEHGHVKMFVSWMIPLPNHGKFAVKQDAKTGEVYVRPQQDLFEIVLDTIKNKPKQAVVFLAIIAMISGKNAIDVLITALEALK